MTRWLLLACTAAMGFAVAAEAAPQAAEPSPQAAERSALATQRARVLANHALEESACRERFAVTDCVERVRQRRREALAPLRERELALDEADRHERAAARLRQVQGKREAAAARPEVPAPVLRLREPPQPASAPRRPTQPAADAVAREREAAERAAAAGRRREQAEATRQRIEERQRQRAAEGRQAAPLPVPAASNATR